MDSFFDFLEKVFFPLFVGIMLLCIAGLGYGIYLELKPPTITEGVVTKLEHFPEDSDVIMMPMVISTGKTTTTIMTPTYVHHPESFRVVIKNGKETEDFYVDKKTYKQLKVGVRYRAQDNAENTRPENTRDATDAEKKRMEE